MQGTGAYYVPLDPVLQEFQEKIRATTGQGNTYAIVSGPHENGPWAVLDASTGDVLGFVQVSLGENKKVGVDWPLSAEAITNGPSPDIKEISSRLGR